MLYLHQKNSAMIGTTSLAEQLKERLQNEPIVFVDASLAEYWAVLDGLGEESFPMEYDIEYINGQIRAQSGIASDRHEVIVANIASLLRTAFYDIPDIRVMGSNKTVYITDCELAVKPDVLAVKGESSFCPRKGQEAGITNPYLLVEVHSDSTRGDDLFNKLSCCQQLNTVQYIVYVEQFRPLVSVYTKQQDNRHWLNEIYNRLDMAVRLGDAELLMQDIYHKIEIGRF